MVYKGDNVDCGFRVDVIVDRLIIVETKAVEKVMPVHQMQRLPYLRLTGLKLGLLLNFHSAVMRQGIKRIVNKS